MGDMMAVRRRLLVPPSSVAPQPVTAALLPTSPFVSDEVSKVRPVPLQGPTQLPLVKVHLTTAWLGAATSSKSVAATMVTMEMTFPTTRISACCLAVQANGLCAMAGQFAGHNIFLFINNNLLLSPVNWATLLLKSVKNLDKTPIAAFTTFAQ